MSLLNGLFPIGTDSEGRTLPKCWLYSYETGTNTPKDTYSDVGLTTPNANPLESDGSGWFANVYLGSGGYKLVLRNAADVVIKEQDDYYQAADGSDIANIEAEIATVEQQIARNVRVCTDSGAADAYVLTAAGSPIAPTAYSNNMVVIFKPTNANTGASTANLNGLGVRNLYDQDGNALPSGFITTDVWYSFIYTSSNFRYLSRSGLINTDYIEDLAITAGKLATGAALANLVDGTVPAAKIEDGTANKLLGFSGAGVITEITNPMRLLSSGSVTAAANISFSLSTLQSAQSADNSYLIRLVGIAPATDDVELYMTFSSDGGSTYASTNYDYTARGLASNANTVRNSNGNAQAQATVAGASDATYSLGNAAGENGTFEYVLTNFNTGASVRPAVAGTGAYWCAAGFYVNQNYTCSNSTAADYDAVRFTLEGGGNFAATGKFYIYSIPGIT
jgi:hypothetical protein